MLLPELTWPRLSELSRETPVVIPIAAVEQHGHHLPLFTDSMLLGEVVRRVESQMQSDVLFTPLMWYGNSHHVRQRYRERNDLLLLFATYWSLGTQPATELHDIHQQAMGHAGEWETSMMLRLAPHLVGEYQKASVVEPGNPFTPASRAWITKVRSRDWQPSRGQSRRGPSGFASDPVSGGLIGIHRAQRQLILAI